MTEPLVIDAKHTIPASDLAWHAVRASGPGGQNVNKVSSKVELRFALETTTAIDASTKARLRNLGKRFLIGTGELVLASQLTRDQRRNLEDTREKLKELIVAALVRPKKRFATKPTRASKERRLDAKKRNSSRKQARRGDDE